MVVASVKPTDCPFIPKRHSVLVLMATFNGERWIREQLDSIFSQDMVDVTVVVSDDRSSDGTPAIVQQYMDQGFTIRLLSNSNRELGSPVRNFFRLVTEVDFTGFDYILFSDQDDIWEPGKINHAIEQIVAYGADCYASNLLAFFPDGRTKVIKKNYSQKTLDYFFQGASAGCTYCFSKEACFVVKQAIKDSYSLLPKNASHDWLVYAITRSRGFRWIIDSYNGVRYRQHGGNSYGGSTGIMGVAKRLKLFSDGWYRDNVLLVAQYCLLKDDEKKVINALIRFNWRDRIFLASNTIHFRRKFSECIALAVLILFRGI